MSLAISGLFDWAEREFGGAAGSDRFEANFLDAINDVLDDLSFRGALGAPLTHASATGDTVTGLDADDTAILRKGLRRYLMSLGSMKKDGADAYRFARAEWEDAMDEWHAKKLRDDMATQDDDDVPTADIFGLGYLGEG
jgi:hypothetical protein